MTTDAFDLIAASLDPGMVVVTSAHDGERAGCLVGFHSQSSIDPQRYCVWLSKANHTGRIVRQASTLAVHFLTADQRELAVLFGTHSGDDVDKFARCPWEEGPDGVPLLADVPRRIVGRRIALLDEGGDHLCVVLEPTAAEADGPFTPLRLADVDDLTPGHEAEERPSPPTERAD
jgi:flavin reductase (DIM6/NTAB) family NADH-FMN oxidoreductase RutF